MGRECPFEKKNSEFFALFQNLVSPDLQITSWYSSSNYCIISLGEKFGKLMFTLMNNVHVFCDFRIYMFLSW